MHIWECRLCNQFLFYMIERASNKGRYYRSVDIFAKSWAIVSGLIMVFVYYSVYSMLSAGIADRILIINIPNLVLFFIFWLVVFLVPFNFYDAYLRRKHRY